MTLLPNFTVINPRNFIADGSDSETSSNSWREFQIWEAATAATAADEKSR
jgi:hypothetical protein